MSRAREDEGSPALTLAGFRSPGVVVLLSLALAACGGEGGEASGEDGGEAEASAVTTRIENAGFRAPESVLHDTDADVYLVSNVNGEPTAEDDNGFVSRVSPDGSVDSLMWIDGAAGDFTLNAPKGMKILGDSLYVADIGCVRVFVRPTGAHSHDICFPEATFLNDLTVDENNIFYVTDTGTEETPGAIYRFAVDGDRAELAEGELLGGPNGIAFTPRGLLVVSSRSGEIYRIDAKGQRTPVAPASDRQLDGIVFRQDQSFYFSSWGDSAVYAVGTDGSVSRLVEDVVSPADMGYDAQRNRLLIPLLQQDAVLFAEVQPVASGGPQGDTAASGASSGGS